MDRVLSGGALPCPISPTRPRDGGRRHEPRERKRVGPGARRPRLQRAERGGVAEPLDRDRAVRVTAEALEVETDRGQRRRDRRSRNQELEESAEHDRVACPRGQREKTRGEERHGEDERRDAVPHVLAAVRGGLLSLDEACNRYTLTVEEFLSWQASIDQHGLAGLRTTRIQQYRQ